MHKYIKMSCPSKPERDSSFLNMELLSLLEDLVVGFFQNLRKRFLRRVDLLIPCGVCSDLASENLPVVDLGFCN